jgi:hypothetical protein
MAKYQIMYWQDIPAQVKVQDGRQRAKKLLPQRFQEAIDSAAIAAGKTDSDAYMSGWRWGPKEERSGPAEQVAEALFTELDEAYPKNRLRELILAHARKSNQ